jgi:Peptidase M50B-like
VEVLGQIWQEATATQAPLTRPAALLAGLVGLALVLPRPVWRVSRHAVTIAHEGAHGIAAVLSGRRLQGIRLHSDTSGLTVSSGRPTGPGMALTAAAGYLGPAAIGLLAAWLLGRGYAVGVLWFVLVMLAVLLLQIRNFFGLWSVLVTGAAVFAVTWWLPERWQTMSAYIVTWFALLAAPRPVLELQADRRRRRTTTSDADQLARLTRLPALAWVGTFLLATVGALVIGAGWLLTPTVG